MSMFYCQRLLYVVAIAQCGSPNQKYHILPRSAFGFGGVLKEIRRYQEESVKGFYKDFPNIKVKPLDGVIVLYKEFRGHDSFLKAINAINLEFKFTEETNPRLAPYKLLLNLLKQSENWLSELFWVFFQRKPLGSLIKRLDRYLPALESGDKNKLGEFIRSDDVLSEELLPKIGDYLHSSDLRGLKIVRDATNDYLIKMLGQIATALDQDSAHKQKTLEGFQGESEEYLLFKCLLALWREENIPQLKEVFKLYGTSKAYLTFVDFHLDNPEAIQSAEIIVDNPEAIQSAEIIVDDTVQEVAVPVKGIFVDLIFSPRMAPCFKGVAGESDNKAHMQPTNSEASTATGGDNDQPTEQIEDDSNNGEDIGSSQGTTGELPSFEIETSATAAILTSSEDSTILIASEDGMSAENPIIMEGPLIEMEEPSVTTFMSVLAMPKEEIKKTDAANPVNPQTNEANINLTILTENLTWNVSNITWMPSIALLNFLDCSTFGDYVLILRFIFLICCEIVYIKAVIIWLIWLAEAQVRAKYVPGQKPFRNMCRDMFGLFYGFKYIQAVPFDNQKPPSVRQQISCGRRRNKSHFLPPLY